MNKYYYTNDNERNSLIEQYYTDYLTIEDVIDYEKDNNGNIQKVSYLLFKEKIEPQVIITEQDIMKQLLLFCLSKIEGVTIENSNILTIEDVNNLINQLKG